MRLIAVIVLILGLGGAAQAAGLAVLVANESFAAARARGAADVLRVEPALRAAGFTTDIASDLSAPALRAALAAVPDRLRRAGHERVVLVYAGYTLNGAGGAWLMGTETRAPDLATVDATGVRLDSVLAIAGQIQGGAIVAIADLGWPQRPGPGLAAGLPDISNVPQGVTLVRGSVAQVTGFLRLIARPGTTVTAAAAQTRGLRLEGFAPPHVSFLPEGFEPARAADLRAWNRAETDGTAASYRAYLADFPDGLYADTARAALDRLENTPERIEQALALTRDERRAIQRDLTLLGYDPRGIDGVFGAGTRSAISAWQGRNGLSQTGFLTRDQIFTLAGQGARRAAELDAEARDRQLVEERADRAFWRDTGAGADETGLRAYLDRFPRGIFAGIAVERLNRIDADRRAELARQDRADWDRARTEDSVRAYRRYLSAWPDGAYTAAARQRIADLSRPAPPPFVPPVVVPPAPPPAPPPVVPPAEPEVLDPAIAQARDREAALNLPEFARTVIQQRLSELGYDTWRTDGLFDGDTRRAIFTWQQATGQTATGYLTEVQVARLLGGSVLRLLE